MRAGPRMALLRIMSLANRGLFVSVAMAVSVCIGVLFTPALAQAQSAVVRDIQVQGSKRVEPETVRSYLQFSVGDAYDAGKVDGSLKALFGTGLFQDVNIDRQGSTVVITVGT